MEYNWWKSNYCSYSRSHTQKMFVKKKTKRNKNKNKTKQKQTNKKKIKQNKNNNKNKHLPLVLVDTSANFVTNKTLRREPDCVAKLLEPLKTLWYKFPQVTQEENLLKQIKRSVVNEDNSSL